VISFFPTAYKDEILYSIINRYHIRSANISYTDTIKDLYNSKYIKSILDLPSNNLILLKSIKLNVPVEKFIEETSLFRYYTAFLNIQRKEDIIKKLSYSDVREIHSLVGAAQKISKYDGYLKLCPQCYSEEIDEFGEGYLHKLHQIPSVFVCSKHRCILKRSKKPFSFYSNYFTSIDQMDFIDFKEVKIIQDNIEILILLANDCNYILDNDVENKDIEWFSEQYKNRLKQLNLCTPKGIVSINEVKSMFIEFYGQDILNLFDLDIFNEEGSNWLKYIIRNKRYILNPIKHIMFIRFLGLDIRDIFTKKIEYKPFGYGQWPCMNKVCNNYRKRVIDTIEISYNSKKKSPVGRFRCDCGYTYSRVGPDKSEEDLYIVGKVIKMGSLWEEKLESLILKGYSLNYIESVLETSQKTIKKYAIKLGYIDYVKKRCKLDEVARVEEKKAKKELNKKLKIEEYRLIWLKLIEENPNMNITQLRESNITVQDYLYRNDREWLYNTYPQKTVGKKGNYLVDWEKRDAEILEEVKIAIKDINLDNRSSITLTGIEKLICRRGYLINNIERLKKTKKYIKNIISKAEDEI